MPPDIRDIIYADMLLIARVKKTPNSLACCNQTTTKFSTAAIECAITEGIFLSFKEAFKVVRVILYCCKFEEIFQNRMWFFCGTVSWASAGFLSIRSFFYHTNTLYFIET